MDSTNVQGLDLKIDKAIQTICEASNSSSGSSRSVLYVIVLVTILTLISIINSHEIYKNKGLVNWTELRLNKYAEDVQRHRDSSRASKDSVIYRDSLKDAERVWETKVRNKIDNMTTVRVPILGNAFDINDLGFIVGVTFCILLFMLRFTVLRELNNLKIALHAITERYTSDANPEDFAVALNQEKDLLKKKSLLECINYTRRQHHYNFLSMNEVYTLPPLQIDDYKIGSFTGFIVRNIFWLPFIIYFLVLGNDFETSQIGRKFGNLSTTLLIVQECVLLILIGWLCGKCTSLKRMVDMIYLKFRNNKYRFEKGEILESS